MDRVDVYDVWAGEDNPWERWMKPALFAQLGDAPRGDDASQGGHYRTAPLPWSDVDVSWAPHASQGTFFLVDLEGPASIELGLALMSRGYRPIVAINACTGPGEVVDMGPVIEAIREGARFPHAFPAEGGEAPAFLLDARRMNATRPLAPTVFDNRWMIFRQDLPSADLLRRHGLSRVVVVSRDESIADDLRHVLYAWQQGSIEILVKQVDRASPPEPTNVQSPSWVHRILGRPAGAGELRRNVQGSFGARIPEPSHG
jgi:hypothetical protein